MHDFHAAGDSAYEYTFDFNKIVGNERFDGDRFSMCILTHRLQCLYASAGAAPRYGSIPDLNPLWARLFNQITIVIQKLNRCIATSDDPLRSFGHITRLMHVEV